MKNIMKKLGIALMAMALVWSCGKDDAPTPPKDTNAAPVIIAQEFTVKEDITPADAIGTVTASDTDKDALTFSIKTNDDDLFAITSAGALTLAPGKALAFIDSSKHVITVEVSDGEAKASAEITIHVTDVVTGTENSAPEVADQEFTVAEDIADTDVIGTVEATDADGDTLSFYVVDDDDSGLFKINAETGELSLKPGLALDFETATEHVIIVEVFDSSGLSPTYATVTIKVTDVYESLASDPNAFVTTWKTETDNEEIIIGTNQNLTYDYTIDWGDGTVEEINTNDNPSHVYAIAGNYTVAILGQFPAIGAENTTPEKLLSIDQWGSIQWESMLGAFAGCTNMTYKATDIPDLSQVTDMSFMFYEASAFNGDIGGWDTSNVTDMSGIFYGAALFNRDISGWDTSKVTNMTEMFAYATSFNQNIGGWDVNNVASMVRMFEGATSFNQNIGGWGTFSLVNTAYMFAGATSFNQPIGGWDTFSVTNMSSMFSGATAFDQPINNWDTSNVTSMVEMFHGATSFNQNLNLWDTSSVTYMTSMFRNATAFNGLVTGWDTSMVTDMSFMFNGATAFNGLLSELDLTSVAIMTGMLDNCGMSSLSYSQTLTGWNNDPNTPSNINLGALGLSVCGNNSGINAFIGLQNNKGWTINDDSDCL